MRKSTPDWILYNGTFLSMNETEEIYSAVAIKDGKIIKVSKDNNNFPERGFGTKLVDLRGKTVLPGFIDCNVHMVQSGLDKYCVKIEDNNKEEFLEELSLLVRNYEEGELIWCVGFEAEGQHLNRWDLDKVSSRHPIVVSRMEFHGTIVNTSAYNMLSIPSTIRGVEKDENGMPTGFLRGEASGFARRKMNIIFVDGALRKKAVEDTIREALKCGITTLNAMEGGCFFSDDDIIAVKECCKTSALDLLLYPQTMDVEEALRYGTGRIGGNLYIDGTIGSKTAALYEPYEHEENRGLLYYNQEDVNQFILTAHEKQLQIAISCIGERAIEQALNAFESAFRIAGKHNHRHRMELFVLPTDEQIQKAIELGLLISMRPNYDCLWGGTGGCYQKNIGKRYKKSNPIGKIIRMGGIVAGGSESGVTPIAPLIGIQSCVNHHEEENRVSVMDALKMYTCNGAYANFAENRIGKIAEGMDADLVVLSENPLEVDAKLLEKTQVLMTMKRGNIVYEQGVKG